MRDTIQRRIVARAVTALKTHPTAEEIYEKIKAEYPNVSLATVYRNLNKLAGEGAILRIPVPNAADRFDFNNETHYHLLCTECSEFCDLPVPYKTELDSEVTAATGYICNKHLLVFTGICTECQKKASAN